MVGERLDDVNIPLDLMLEILKKLPAKSVVRFLLVSKLWKTMIRDYLVKDSIVNRFFLTQPHFIFRRIHRCDTSPSTSNHSFAYSHHQTTHERELLSLEETFGHSYCLPDFQYVRGLIGYGLSDSSRQRCHRFTIHNPTTRQTFSLPNTIYNSTHKQSCSFFFGYEPLSNQYKVVCIARKLHSQEMSCQVYTLCDLKNQWRNIPFGIDHHYPFHYPFHRAVCINGVIYYMAKKKANLSCFLVSFDVGYERFNHVQTPQELSICLGETTLVDYQGKLGCICEDNLNMDMWVLENAEWSKITYVDVLAYSLSHVRFAGITHPGGEMIFVSRSLVNNLTPITVYYYDMKLKTSRRLEIRTAMSSRELICISKVVTDHVENIMCLS